MFERLLTTMIVPLMAVLIGVLVAMVFLTLTGYPAFFTFRAIYEGSFQDWYGFGQVVRSATLLAMTGLAVAVAFHAGLFNIGVEGQLYIGAVALGILGYYLKGMPRENLKEIPWPVFLILAVAISMLCSAAWASIPGLLKAATGAHEVISTIMMNWIAYSLVNYLLRPGGTFAQPGRMQTPAMPRHFRVPRLSEHAEELSGSTLNYASALAVLAAISTWFMLRFTRFGFALRAVGKNSDAAHLAGIGPGRMIVLSMVISGAIAGLVGVEFVLGHKGYFEENFSAGLGFLGIAVALLANNHPIGILFTAFLFGTLNYSAVAIPDQFSKYISEGRLPESTLVPPKDIIEIMQAAIILSVILGNKAFGTLLLRMRKRRLSSQAIGPAELPPPVTSPV